MGREIITAITLATQNLVRAVASRERNPKIAAMTFGLGAFLTGEKLTSSRSRHQHRKRYSNVQNVLPLGKSITTFT